MTHALESITLKNHRGHDIALGTLWRERPVVALFVRHFGCVFCREQLADAELHHARIRAHGAQLVVVGNGSVEQARDFVDETGTEALVLRRSPISTGR